MIGGAAVTRRRRAGRPAAAAVALIVVALLGACGGSSDGAAPGTTATTAPSTTTASSTTVPADCSPARTVDAGAGPRIFTFDGLERTYLLSVPEGNDGTEARPIVFDFHGHGGTKESQAASTELARRGAEAGFVVVTPDGTESPQRWNMFGTEGHADDVGFVNALLADLETTLCIDPDRVFAAGHSNGSAFTAFLSCRPPQAFAAVALVSATTPAGCPAAGSPSLLAIAGTDDATVPYDGGAVGGGAVGIPDAPGVVAWYADKYRCDPEPTRRQVHPGVERTTFTGCASGIEVALDTVDGGTHTWPGGPAARRDERESEAGRTYDATGAILEFFQDHPRQAR